jgi:TonB family protein
MLADSHLLTWLIEQQLYICIVMIVLVFFEKKFLPSLGAKLSYSLWLILPAAMILNNLPLGFVAIESNEITRYLVSIKPPEFSLIELNYLPLVWGLGVLIIIFLGFFAKQQQQISSSLFPASSTSLPISLPEKLRLYHSDSVSSPLLLGVYTPKLVLPTNYQSLYSQTQLRMILEHEIYHFKRKDNLCNSVAIIFLSLFWFNPLIWVGYFSYRRVQEISCDSAVLKSKTKLQSIEYGKALLICAEQTSTKLCAYTHYGEKSTMLQRINNLKQNKSPKPLAQLAAIALTASLLSGIAVAHQGERHGFKQKRVSPIVRIEPKYPVHAAEEGTEGSVVLVYDITPGGLVENVSIVTAQPQGIFDRQAKIALRQWKYDKSEGGAKRLLVQLDFAMGKDSEKAPDLLERIKVTQ